MLTMLDKKSIKNLIKRERQLKQNPIRALLKKGITRPEIRYWVDELPELSFYKTYPDKLTAILNPVATTPIPDEGEFTETEEKIQFKGKSSKIHNIEELVKAYNIDTNIWKPVKFIKKIWEMGYKDSDDKGQTLPLYSIHAEFKLIEGASEAKKLIEYFKEKLKTGVAPTIDWSGIKEAKKRKGEKYMLEINIPDLHAGRTSWGVETGSENYDTNIASNLFKTAIFDLINKAPMDQIDEILFPVGSDFFNADGSSNSTTGGTPQDVDSRWTKTFRKGLELLIEVFEHLGKDKIINVPTIAGNHDYQQSFYLGECLSCYFHNHPNVKINNAPTLRKYFCYGKTLIGLTHGDKEKKSNLALIMAQEQPKEWGECKFKEIHIGHLHSEIVNEYNGVKVRVLSSLAAPCAWSASKGYTNNTRSASSFLYDFNNGLVAQYFFNH